MSLSQAILFWRAIQRARARRLADLAVVIRVAFGARGPEFERFLDALEVDDAGS